MPPDSISEFTSMAATISPPNRILYTEHRKQSVMHASYTSDRSWERTMTATGTTITEMDHFHAPEILFSTASAMKMSTITEHMFIFATITASIASGVYRSSLRAISTAMLRSVQTRKRSRTSITPK